MLLLPVSYSMNENRYGKSTNVLEYKHVGNSNVTDGGQIPFVRNFTRL